MKVLSNPAAIHTQRWVSALAKRGVEIMLYSFYPCEKVDYYRGIKHVQVKSFWQSRDSKGIKGFILVKLFTYYLVLIKDIRNSFKHFIRISFTLTIYRIMVYSGRWRVFILSSFLHGEQMYMIIPDVHGAGLV